jgi:hypothetical protein
MDQVVRLAAFAAAFLCLAAPAHAYLDPVTGSLLVQGLVAVIAGVVAGVKSVRRKVVAGVRALFRQKGA